MTTSVQSADTESLSFNARVLRDSICPKGNRVITVEATFPRFILAEVNTHCVLSRNSASSRAIPTEKLLSQVINSPFIPEVFYERTKGMGQGEPIEKQEAPRYDWLQARDAAVRGAENLIYVAKSQANRLLEPFMWHTIVLTATEWNNFFGLRHPWNDDGWLEEVDTSFPSQPEFQKIAILMRNAMLASTPDTIEPDRWHLPMVKDHELEDHTEHPDGFWPMVSAGRCARWSYWTQHGDESPERSHERAELLERDGHMSPFEHPCRPAVKGDRVGKLRGWTSLRQVIPNEENPMQRKWDS